MPPGLKQFRQEGCLSYLVYDFRSGEGMLVDPRADLIEDYRQFIAERRLRLTLMVDTRLHWHHLSGSHLIAEAFGVPVAMSARTESKRATRKLAGGEKLAVGSLRFQVLETPGAGPDAICLYGEGLLFSGDTVVAGTPARVDLTGGEAAALWTSLRCLVGSLPDSTIVLPGFDTQDLIFSTIEVEKKRGPDWAHGSREAFIRAKTEERAPRGDGEVRHRIEYNLASRPAANAESHFGGTGPAQAGESRGGVAAISVEKYALKIKERSPENCFLDVREPEEFKGGHMPCARNIPLSELPLHWRELAAYKRVYVSCQSGRRSHLAASTLDYLGLRDVVNVTGGIRAWENAGNPIET